MRFNLFGFKGNLDTIDGSTTSKQPKEDKGGPNTVICTGYRPFSDFDRPIDPPPQQINHVNQASTSGSAANGVLPKSKSGKLKIQQDTSSKDKTKPTKLDKTKEQKQQKDAIKAQKAEEKIKAKQLKEKQAINKQGKEKKKSATGQANAIPGSEPVSAAAFTQKAKSSSNSKSKSKSSKAPATPPMPAAAAVNPIIFAKQQQKKDKEKDSAKHKSTTSEDVELRHKDKSSRHKLKMKEQILPSDKAKSLPNLTNPNADTDSINIVAGKTSSKDVNKKHKSTPAKVTPTHKNNLPEKSPISIVFEKTTATPSKADNAKKHKSISPQRSKPANSDSDDYEDNQNDGSLLIVSGKTNAASSRDKLNSTPLTIPPPIAPQRSKQAAIVHRNDLPNDGSITTVSGKTNSVTPALPVPLQRTKTTEDSYGKAKSLPNLANSEQDDYDDDLPTDDGGFVIVSGKTTAAPSNDDDKKSTLIFMTEGDEDDETAEYGYSNNYTSNTSFNTNETKNAKNGHARVQTDYSSHATDIFFSNVEPEPTPRNRKFLVRDDDDNASQTSA